MGVLSRLKTVSNSSGTTTAVPSSTSRELDDLSMSQRDPAPGVSFPGGGDSRPWALRGGSRGTGRGTCDLHLWVHGNGLPTAGERVAPALPGPDGGPAAAGRL